MERNFGNLPDAFTRYDGARIAVLPIAFEASSTWLRGSEKGPEAIIEASANMELYDIETRTEVYRKGIHTCEPVTGADAPEMLRRACAQVAGLLKDGKFVVALGGEHTVSLGPILAHHERHPEMSVLHLDAHGDSRDTYQGDRYSHACVMARAREAVGNVVSVGIRSMDSSELAALDESRMFYAHDIQPEGRWVEDVLGKLSPEVYVTIDLDVFDTGIMPSTGTPEPGGLGWYQVLGLLRAVAGRKTLLGFDVVELCPGPYKAPDFLAAKLIYVLLSYRFKGE